MQPDLEAKVLVALPPNADSPATGTLGRGDQLLTDAELLAAVKEDYAKAAEEAELEFELGLVNHRVRSYDPKTLDYLRAIKAVPADAESVDGEVADSAKLHLRALEILKKEGKGEDYTADEYLLAAEQAPEAA